MNIERKLGRLMAAAAIAVPMALMFGSPAQAETNPACGDVTQIGGTGHIKIGGQTFASVKQFKGCGKNWAYAYVWESWRDNHNRWDLCVSVAVGRAAPFDLADLRCEDNTRRAEMWSSGANTLSLCTHAVGWWPDREHGRTDIRC
jgi:hypothetical protein